MTERTTILQEVGQAFRENGLTAAITALVGGSLAVAATGFFGAALKAVVVGVTRFVHAQQVAQIVEVGLRAAPLRAEHCLHAKAGADPPLMRRE